jgi:hypothetical protein
LDPVVPFGLIEWELAKHHIESLLIVNTLTKAFPFG